MGQAFLLSLLLVVIGDVGLPVALDTVMIWECYVVIMNLVRHLWQLEDSSAPCSSLRKSNLQVMEYRYMLPVRAGNKHSGAYHNPDRM